jgi:hypothetical protein
MMVPMRPGLGLRLRSGATPLPVVGGNRGAALRKATAIAFTAAGAVCATSLIPSPCSSLIGLRPLRRRAHSIPAVGFCPAGCHHLRTVASPRIELRPLPAQSKCPSGHGLYRSPYRLVPGLCRAKMSTPPLEFNPVPGVPAGPGGMDRWVGRRVVLRECHTHLPVST